MITGLDRADAALACADDVLEDPLVLPIYYVSDLHLEHQAGIAGKPPKEIGEAIWGKAKELAASIASDRGVIVIAGDVSDDMELASRLVYCINASLKSVRRHMPMLVTLGNHELWDAAENGFTTVDEAVARYRAAYECGDGTRWGQSAHDRPSNVFLAHNELMLGYTRKDCYRFARIGAQELLDMDDASLRQRVLDAESAILAGMGFTGNDPQRNVASGAYGRAPCLTPEQDGEQSALFRALHDKLARCVGDLPLAVVTHTPMHNWSDGAPNAKWVYISGHTHDNAVTCSEDGACMLADNQMGYDPQPWHFKEFSWRGGRDPFEGWGDGIYEIDAERYVEFNRYRGISVSYGGGPVHMLKRGGVYMFFTDTPRGLRMLEGGRARVVGHGLQYYHDNLSRYYKRVVAAFAPYRRALKALSAEVKAFGGTGTVHGSIVDIDWWRHVFLNPLDGTVTPYFAWDMVDKSAYSHIAELLAGTPYEERFLEERDAGHMPLLVGGGDGTESELAKVPIPVLDTRMYSSSRVTRAVQYVFDKGIVRIWNDEVLRLPEPRGLVEPERGVLPGAG